MLDVGMHVKWTSQAGAHWKEKVGVIAEVVPAGKLPDRNRFLYLHREAGIGSSRKHVSYVVLVGNKPYWPIAKKLVPIRLEQDTKFWVINRDTNSIITFTEATSVGAYLTGRPILDHVIVKIDNKCGDRIIPIKTSTITDIITECTKG